MPDKTSAQSVGIVSDGRVRDVLRDELHLAISVKRRLTRDEIAEASEVNIHTIDAIISRSPAKHRTVGMGTALSLAVVLGPRAVNRLMALIGYGGASPLDEAAGPDVHAIVATGIECVSVIAKAAADGRIDHIEAPDCTEAADMIIATFTPLSSAADAA